MGDQIIEYNTAVTAKEKGFNLVVYERVYNSEGDISYGSIKTCDNTTYSAPTQSLLMRWLREKYFMHANIIQEVDKGDDIYYVLLSLSIRGKIVTELISGNPLYIGDTFEEVQEFALQELLHLIIEPKKK